MLHNRWILFSASFQLKNNFRAFFPKCPTFLRLKTLKFFILSHDSESVFNKEKWRILSENHVINFTVKEPKLNLFDFREFEG